MRLREHLGQDFPVNPKPSARVTVAVFRLGQWAYDKPRWNPLRYLYKVLELVWMRGVAKSDLPPQVQAGPRLYLAHGGLGLVLHPDVRIGADASIFHRVTLGMRGPSGVPHVGDRVFIGTGASVLGPVTIGDDVTIGAGSVVIADVPAGATVVGVPAKIVAVGVNS